MARTYCNNCTSISAHKYFRNAPLEDPVMMMMVMPDCAGIIQVYVRATGLEPPEETWTNTLVSRRPNAPRSAKETAVMKQ